MIFSRSGLELNEIRLRQANLVEADARLRELERVRNQSPEHAHTWYHAMRRAGRGHEAISEIQRGSHREPVADLLRKDGDHDTADHLDVGPHVHAWQKSHSVQERDARAWAEYGKTVGARTHRKRSENTTRARTTAMNAARSAMLRRDPKSNPSPHEVNAHASRFLSNHPDHSEDHDHLVNQVVQWTRGHDHDYDGTLLGRRRTSPNGQWHRGTLGAEEERDGRAKQIGDAVKRLGIGHVTSVSKSRNNHVLSIKPARSGNQ